MAVCLDRNMHMSDNLVDKTILKTLLQTYKRLCGASATSQRLQFIEGCIVPFKCGRGCVHPDFPPTMSTTLQTASLRFKLVPHLCWQLADTMCIGSTGANCLPQVGVPLAAAHVSHGM